MKILKEDNNPGGLRVIERFSWIPKKIKTTCKTPQWIFCGQTYYVLQRLNYRELIWMDEEESIDPNEWNFKWSESYLNCWKSC